MRKISSKIIITVLLLVAAILGLVNEVYIKNSTILQEVKLLNIVDGNLSNIEQLEVYGSLYNKTKNREYFDEINSAAYQISKNLDLLLNGGKTRFGEEEIDISKNSNEDITNVIKRFSSKFDFHLEQINKLTSLPSTENQSSANFLINNNGDLMLHNILIRDVITEYISSTNKYRSYYSMAIFVSMVLIGLFVFYFSWREYVGPLKKLSVMAEGIAKGEIESKEDSTNYRGLAKLREVLDIISKNIREASHFAINIGKGEFDRELKLVSSEDALGKSLVEMRDRLMTIAKEESQRNWVINGVAKFSDILRNQQYANLEELSFQFIENLVKYADSNQGGVFLINDENEKDKYVQLVSSYAFEKRKYVEKRIELEEGLIGQCLLEKDQLYLEDVPEEYINITSGLGQANPKAILITPIMVNEDVFGAIELASFHGFQEHSKEFVANICESFGSTISVIKMNTHTQRLLEETKKVNIELQEKEEQMNQFAEELKANQEELSRDLGERTNLNNHIIDAINKTNAQVEFDMEGNILEVNSMYLSVMGYDQDELVGQNEKILVKNEELEGYNLMWESINEGSFHGGEYCRVGKKGNEVWINGTYNPIKNLEGEVYKVIQFGQFTTEEKERDLDLRSRINAFNSEFPTVDLDIEGNVIKANQKFIKFLGFKRTELRNKNYADLIQSSEHGSFNFNSVWNDVITGNPRSLIIDYNTGGDHLSHCITNITPLKDLSGNIYKVMIVLVDVTMQKDLELDLISNQDQLPESIAELKSISELLNGTKEVESQEQNT